MEHVTGIGGIFFKAKDPKALSEWYAANLGIKLEEYGGATFLWSDPKGATIWSPFSADTTYFAPSEKPFMLNYRVRNLAAMLEQLRAAGAVVDEKVDDSPHGKFGWAMDPEGNRIELWEPKE